MSIRERQIRESSYVLRVGAAGIYIIVGLVAGVAVSALLAVLGTDGASPSFATVTFGISAFSALLAALFPNAALASFAGIAHVFWGLFVGSVASEAFSGPAAGASKLSQFFFWLGFLSACALWLEWLLA